jgi:hypothetical protein
MMDDVTAAHHRVQAVVIGDIRFTKRLNMVSMTPYDCMGRG